MRKYMSDKCIFCGRELITPRTKKYMTANEIREFYPNFCGRKMLGAERGAIVCKSKKKCIATRQEKR
jgi:hypothetical protein